MNYQETLQWMFNQLPMYQRQGESAFKKDLTNITALSHHLSNPHLKLKAIHVAGTNGKGSTSHMLASILQEEGYKVGLYTSPHLKDFRERIKINGKEISQEEVINFIDSNKEFLEKHKLSFFEMTVGMAFNHFALQDVDYAVVEVGLGGRLDSTNILNPLLSIITNIGFDHTQFLGETLPEIAFEKGGIIKPNTPVVLGEFNPETYKVFQKLSELKNAVIYQSVKIDTTGVECDLKGGYQQNNIKTTIKAIDVMNAIGVAVSRKSVLNGLKHVVKNTGLKGRWQILQDLPKVICDTAHNKEGLSYVIKQLNDEVFHKLHIVLGVVDDKDLDHILPLFPKMATYYFCKPNIIRGLNANQLKSKAGRFGLNGGVYESVTKAYEEAKNKALDKDLIFVGGSTFVVAELPL